jgi:hypothetical protein
MPAAKLENKSARILHISMGGGETLAVPPSEGGIVVRFAEGAEAEAFAKNIATQTVQEWIDSGELVITEAPDEPEVDPEPAADGGEAEDDE